MTQPCRFIPTLLCLQWGLFGVQLVTKCRQGKDTQRWTSLGHITAVEEAKLSTRRGVALPPSLRLSLFFLLLSKFGIYRIHDSFPRNHHQWRIAHLIFQIFRKWNLLSVCSELDFYLVLSETRNMFMLMTRVTNFSLFKHSWEQKSHFK